MNESNILYLGFSVDKNSFVVGETYGYKIYQISFENDKIDLFYTSQTRLPDITQAHRSGEPESQSTDRYQIREIRYVERLLSTSLVVVTSYLIPRRIRVFNVMRNTEIYSHNYKDTVVRVCMNRKVLICYLQDEIHMHSINDMAPKHIIKDVPRNPNGVCALSDDDSCIFVFPSSSERGEIQVFDAHNFTRVTEKLVHETEIAALSLSPGAKFLGTASSRGTLIRLYKMPNVQLLAELRSRQIASAQTYSISWSDCCGFLAASYNTKTIHVFDIRTDVSDDREEAPASFISSFTPTAVSEFWNQKKSFATAKLNTEDKRTACSLITKKNGDIRLYVAVETGWLYIFDLDTRNDSSKSVSLMSYVTSTIYTEPIECRLLHRIDFTQPMVPTIDEISDGPTRNMNESSDKNYGKNERLYSDVLRNE
ncbi:hypothetical protein SNEBB_005607 [Seison nebaliae]|nr:hypothetical protein SNEBB_005607 [Seison nebaliae]